MNPLHDQVEELRNALDTIRNRQQSLEDTCSWQWRKICLLSSTAHTAAPGTTTTTTTDNSQMLMAQAAASLATSSGEVGGLRTLLITKTREFDAAMEAMRCRISDGEEARIALTRTMGMLSSELSNMQVRQVAVERALSTREAHVANREVDVANREDAIAQREADVEARELTMNTERAEEATESFYMYIAAGWTVYGEKDCGDGGGADSYTNKMDRCLRWFKKAALIKHTKPSDSAIAWASMGHVLSQYHLDSSSTIHTASTSPSPVVEINGAQYDNLQCYIRSLELDPEIGTSWHNLAAYYFRKQSSVWVGDREYTITQMFIKALESKLVDGMALSWASL